MLNFNLIFNVIGVISFLLSAIACIIIFFNCNLTFPVNGLILMVTGLLFYNASEMCEKIIKEYIDS